MTQTATAFTAAHGSGEAGHELGKQLATALTAQRPDATAVRALGGATPSAALFFDCVATRLRLGETFGFELDAVQAALGATNLVGCNTYGQIARAGGQFSGFHNCTAVVLAFPR